MYDFRSQGSAKLTRINVLLEDVTFLIISTLFAAITNSVETVLLDLPEALLQRDFLTSSALLIFCLIIYQQPL